MSDYVVHYVNIKCENILHVFNRYFEILTMFASTISSHFIFFRHDVYVYICSVHDLAPNRTSPGYVSNCWYDLKSLLFCSGLFQYVDLQVFLFYTRNLFSTHKWYKKHSYLFHVLNLFIGIDTNIHFYLDYYYVDICFIWFKFQRI